MRSFASTAIAAVAALYARGTLATTSSYCPSDSQDVCFRWGVPEASASSGSGSVYFQIEAPSSYQWVGLGIGSRMSGAEMFIVYQDGSGNVTLSTRRGSGHSMPQYTERSDVELLEGSGVVNDKMVANIRCTECDRLELGGTNTWIAAWREGDSLDSTNLRATIQVHDDNGSFEVDFSQATISSDANPFVNSSSDGESDGSGSNSGTKPGAGNDDAGSDSNSGGSGGGAISETNQGSSNALVYAHGIVMSVVFLIGYPLGAALMPLVGKWQIHASWQVLAFLGMWAGFGIGYYLADRDGYWWNDRHVQLGTIVVALMVLQPVLGFVHHKQYLKTQQRTAVSHVHIWFGRILMILGIINGGLGLQLGKAPNGFIIAYSIVSVVVAVIYGASSFVRGMRKSRGEKIGSPEMRYEPRRQV